MVVLTRSRRPAPMPPPEPPAATAQVTPAAADTPEAPPATPAPVPSASAAPAAEPNALADIVLEFGESGRGPGQLDDARAIAVDPGGDIYVAEYGSLRVQKIRRFGEAPRRLPGPNGASTATRSRASRRRTTGTSGCRAWATSSSCPSGEGGIAVDEKGRIFLGAGRGIEVYDATGTKLGEIRWGTWTTCAMGRDGRLYTVSRSRVRVLKLR